MSEISITVLYATYKLSDNYFLKHDLNKKKEDKYDFVLRFLAYNLLLNMPYETCDFCY